MTVSAEKPKKVMSKKIAIVVHQEHSRPGRVGALLEKRGYELDRLCPNLGCDLPEDMSDYAGVVIFGGPMSANDCGTLAGIKCELEWIPKVVEAGVRQMRRLNTNGHGMSGNGVEAQRYMRAFAHIAGDFLHPGISGRFCHHRLEGPGSVNEGKRPARNNNPQ